MHEALAHAFALFDVRREHTFPTELPAPAVPAEAAVTPWPPAAPPLRYEVACLEHWLDLNG